MGFVLEFLDIFKKLSPVEIVYEYQQGLYLFLGKARERTRQLTPEQEETYSKLEREVAHDYRRLGIFKSLMPLPPEYRRSLLTGKPLHKDRYSKILGCGGYLLFPGLCNVIKASAQEKPLDLGSITVLSADDPPVALSISCNILYKLEDLYKAYTAVDDYEDSLKIETLSQLSECCYGRKLTEWKERETIRTVQDETTKLLQESVTERWGLKILDLTITDVAPSTTQRVVYTGQSIPVTLTNESPQEAG